MARFKDKTMDIIYQGLLGKTPDQLLEMKVFGSIHSAFKRGYDQLPFPCYMPRNCVTYAAYVYAAYVYAAYVAGKETKS